ncbi:hypothetical protein WN979_16625 [Streptomyces albidoflavus]|uniref:hypothetical protein n=1 Tax=Streptomyces albidoflavus TaxID=1886 RepID=UPI0032485E0D
MTLLFGVRNGGTWPPEGYEPGPGVFCWRRREGETWSTGGNRAKYTHADLVDMVWSPAVRCHRTVPRPAADDPSFQEPSPSGFVVDTIELVRLNQHARSSLVTMRSRPAADSVAVIHGHLPEHQSSMDLVAALRRSADLDPDREQGAHRAWANSVLPPGYEVARDQREATYLALVTSATSLPRLSERSAQSGLDAADQWLVHLYEASADVPSTDLTSRQIPLAGGLPTVVGPRGLVSVGTRSDVVQAGHPVSYYEGSSYQQRTLYTDALVMGRLQDLLIDAVDSEVEHAARATPDRRRIFRLERDFLVFRRSYLRATFGRGFRPALILRTWQRHADTHGRVQILKDDLTELSRQVQTFETETTNAILGLIATIGLPLATGLAIWAGLPDAGVKSLWQTLVPVGAVVVTLVAAVPALRRLTLNAFKRRHRGE